ncbi:hypothetical protein QJS10_CPB17g00341 [Acorus calamus]|uniref:Myb/SANT-like domain-containing protein n=1 Tax=Acorus calamus TaxID=4465 RepID=A0AAV9CY43_ACOCL|nr:hypothetical protein QJS10_CPB17g00341 [Acorus calamus]
MKYLQNLLKKKIIEKDMDKGLEEKKEKIMRHGMKVPQSQDSIPKDPSNVSFYAKMFGGTSRERNENRQDFQKASIYSYSSSYSNVENHLRTLKTKYMSGVGWDDTLKMITMDNDAYNEYVQAHVKDEPYLNKPIEMYDEMMIICGDDQATGSFA